jgi:hypothetical protein
MAVSRMKQVLNGQLQILSPPAFPKSPRALAARVGTPRSYQLYYAGFDGANMFCAIENNSQPWQWLYYWSFPTVEARAEFGFSYLTFGNWDDPLNTILRGLPFHRYQ